MNVWWHEPELHHSPQCRWNGRSKFHSGCWSEWTGQFAWGSAGWPQYADELGVPLLAEIPLDEPLREAADGGTPLVLSAPDAESAQALSALAEALPGALRPRSGAERISRRLGVLS